MFGYDYVLSIEHEDSLMSAEEGLMKASSFLNDIVIKDAQGPEIYVIRVMVMVEREMPVGAKPICFCVIAVLRANGLDHGGSSRMFQGSQPGYSF